MLQVSRDSNLKIPKRIENANGIENEAETEIMIDVSGSVDLDLVKAFLRDSAWTENWDLAVRSFTKRSEINKIVFTDGEPCSGTMPKDDLKRENVVIWLVYGNRDFKPCCGKVIHITERQLEQLHLVTENYLEEAISR